MTQLNTLNALHTRQCKAGDLQGAAATAREIFAALDALAKTPANRRK